MTMRRETPKIPKLRLDLLNMGAEALAKYLKTTKVATRRWKLGINERNTRHSNSPRMDITTAPADEADEENGGE